MTRQQQGQSKDSFYCLYQRSTLQILRLPSPPRLRSLATKSPGVVETQRAVVDSTDTLTCQISLVFVAQHNSKNKVGRAITHIRMILRTTRNDPSQERCLGYLLNKIAGGEYLQVFADVVVWVSMFRLCSSAKARSSYVYILPILLHILTPY